MIYTDKIPVDKETYEKHLKGFAEKLDERIDFLEDKLKEVDESKRDLYQDNLEKLKDRKKKLAKKLQKLVNTNEQRWNEVYSDVEDKIEDNIREIESTYKKISDHFEHVFDKVNKQD